MAIGLKLQFSWARTETPRGLKMWATPKKMPSSMSEVEFLVTNPRFSLQWILDMLGAQSWCFFRDHDLGLACRLNRVGCFWEFLKVRGTKNKQLLFFCWINPILPEFFIGYWTHTHIHEEGLQGNQGLQGLQKSILCRKCQRNSAVSWPMYRVLYRVWNVVV